MVEIQVFHSSNAFFFFKFIRPTRSGIFITVTKIAALFAIPLRPGINLTIYKHI